MSGSWIFLSHSSKDIKLVRRIRNEFEDCGHNPLAFHLKCLNDSTDEGKAEIFSLLRREIDAREWFVFCESENARNSEYVQFERNYIHQSGKDKIWSLDINQQWDSLKKTIDRISRDLRIYLEFSNQDRKYAVTLCRLLEQSDFTVWTNENTNRYQGNPWLDSLKFGLVIYIISEHTHIPALLGEFEYITGNINGGETIVPLFVGTDYSNAVPQDIEAWLRSGPSFDIPHDAKDGDFLPLIRHIEGYYVQRILKD